MAAARPPGRARGRPPVATVITTRHAAAAAAASSLLTGQEQGGPAAAASAARAPSRAARASVRSSTSARGRRGRTAPTPAAAGHVESTEPASPAVTMSQLREVVRDVVQETLQAAPAPASGTVQSAPPSDSALTGAAVLGGNETVEHDNHIPQTGALSTPPPPVLPGACATPMLADLPADDLGPCISAEAGDLSLNIADHVKQKIMEHKFIEMGLMLSSARDPPANSSTFQVVAGRIQTPSAPRQITSFGVWCTAFLRFAGIYLTAHAHDAAGLLTHMRQVGYLHSRGLGFAWREFDTQFRRARELAPAQYPWGAVTASSSIWLSAIAGGASFRAGAVPGGSPAATAGPRGICFQFNAGACRRRDRCIFRHACRLCHGPHSFVQCPRRLAHLRPPPAGPSTRDSSKR